MNSLSFITDFVWQACLVLKNKFVQLNPREQKIAFAAAAIFTVLPGLYAMVYSLRASRVSHRNPVPENPMYMMTRAKIMERADNHFNGHHLKQSIMDQLGQLLPIEGGHIRMVEFPTEPFSLALANKVIIKNEIKLFLMGQNITFSEAE